MLRQYSCLRSTRIFPTTIIISAAFAPRVSVIWHVFIVYMDWIISPIKWAFVSWKLCYVSSPNQHSKDQSIFTFIETNLFAGLIQQHLSFSESCKLFTPVPPSGSKVNCSAVETASLLNHLSACQHSLKICLRVICANLLEVVLSVVMADNVLGLYNFGVLCLSSIILFKMYIHFLEAWTAYRAVCCPLWHCCHPYFLFPRLSLDPST